jgi:flagellar protein FlaG
VYRLASNGIPKRNSQPEQIQCDRRTFHVQSSTWGKRSLLQSEAMATLLPGRACGEDDRHLSLPCVPFRHIEAFIMATPAQPNIRLTNSADYRETYANSVQIRVNVWDFFLVFGTLQQQSQNEVEVKNFQGIYLSPQQAKALLTILEQNVSSYEKTFGEIKLDPRMATSGVIN